MRVFVAGATGVIGRPLVRILIAAGHDVIGMTRTPEKATAIATAGARPIVCDALDADGVRAAVQDARPDVVVHQLTALPSRYDPRHFRRMYRDTDRLHHEGTDHLLAAALDAGARRFVVQSIAFGYERVGSRVKTEDAPLDPAPPRELADAAEALAHLERTAASATGIETVVLRYGMFYGPGTWYAPDGHFASEARRRRFPIIGDGQGVFSFVHVEDAAVATRLAIESDATGPFNVADDEPAAQADWLPVWASAVGAPRPWRSPAWLARLAVGGSAVEQLTTLRGADNRRAKSSLGWTLQYPTWRDGFARQRDASGTRS
jgi:nucleoside-diphosphate-sugar epimerase